MNALERFERLIADVLEGSVARALGARLEPVEIARLIDRAMDDNRIVGPGQPIVPNQFVVSLPPDDLDSLSKAQEAISEELAAYVTHRARERRCQLVGRPSVELVAARDPRDSGDKQASARSRGISVTARVVPDRASAAERVHTQRFPVIAPIRPPPQTREPPARERTNKPAPAPTPGRTPANHPSRARTSALEGSGIRLVLDQRTTRVGRALDNDVVLEDSRVSRYHAEIVRQDDAFLLRDLDSTNGTRVNGTAVRERPLQAGDLVSFGGVDLRFV